MSFGKRSRAVLVLMALGLGTSLLAVGRGGGPPWVAASAARAHAPSRPGADPDGAEDHPADPAFDDQRAPLPPRHRSPARGAPGRFFGGFGGSMLRVLMLGGLIGLLLGQGSAASPAMFGFLVQAASWRSA